MYQENHEGFLRFLLHKTHCREDALDVMQEAYQKLINREGLEEMENPRAYLYRTATNIIIDQQRKSKHHQKYVHQVTGGIESGSASEASAIAPDRHVAARQELDSLYRALDELPDKCRRAFLMHREQHLTYGKIASDLEVSVSMVEKYMIQALKHLRRHLK
ncbi:sigma-70 family RNA polymerase sigma factor [Paremcibacter congregatus]